jgi:transcription elongation factor GreA
MSKTTLLTKEGLKEIHDQLVLLKEVKRLEVAEKLKEAISYGDLSENSEYEDARNEQAQTELRIIELEEILKDYELVDAKKTTRKQNSVNVGSFVTIVSIEDDKKEVYHIVGSTESDIFENKISNESPIGNALIGKTIGDIVKGIS